MKDLKIIAETEGYGFGTAKSKAVYMLGFLKNQESYEKYEPEEVAEIIRYLEGIRQKK